MGGASLDEIKSATLDHIITWNFSNDDTAEMLAPKSTVHWLGEYANDHALISCTIDEPLLSYLDPWALDTGGRTGAFKVKKIANTVHSNKTRRNRAPNCPTNHHLR